MSITVKYISMNLKNINLVCAYNLIRAIEGVGGLSCEIERLEDSKLRNRRDWRTELRNRSDWRQLRVEIERIWVNRCLELGNGKDELSHGGDELET
ncbi:hypothetical protein QL285_096014 [Trifolium repens]|nr:hypothetical protein QL285_096014 [Trifolium repens]